MNKKISFSPPDLNDDDIDEIIDTIKSGWITTGPKTKLFEKKIADYCGTDRAVCLNSATASLELSLRMLGIGEGDEVITSAYTYTASCSPIIHVGATPVLIDVKNDSTEMNYEYLRAAINERTKAIIPIDIAGIICDYDKIFQIINDTKSIFVPTNDIQHKMGRIAVIADGAHSFGAVRNGKRSGNIADFTTFSFHAVKNITTAEGGAVTWRDISGINNDDIYKKFQMLSLHGQSKDAFAKNQLGSWEYDIISPAYKCNMTDIAASIGLSQLNRYSDIVNRRHQIIRRYDKACDEIGVDHLVHYGKAFRSSGHLYLTRIPGINHEKRCEIITHMAERGIVCNVHYKPLPLMTAYKNNWNITDFPNSYEYYKNEISLPLHTKLSDENVEYIIYNFMECVKC